MSIAVEAAEQGQQASGAGGCADSLAGAQGPLHRALSHVAGDPLPGPGPPTPRPAKGQPCGPAFLGQQSQACTPPKMGVLKDAEGGAHGLFWEWPAKFA